jgi:hypothetical protein
LVANLRRSGNPNQSAATSVTATTTTKSDNNDNNNNKSNSNNNVHFVTNPLQDKIQDFSFEIFYC